MFILLTSAGDAPSPLRLRAAHVEAVWPDGKQTVVQTVSGMQHAVTNSAEDVQNAVETELRGETIAAGRAARSVR